MFVILYLETTGNGVQIEECHQELTSLKFIAGALITGRLRTENLTAKLVKFLFGIQRSTHIRYVEVKMWHC